MSLRFELDCERHYTLRLQYETRMLRRAEKEHAEINEMLIEVIRKLKRELTSTAMELEATKAELGIVKKKAQGLKGKIRAWLAKASRDE